MMGIVVRSAYDNPMNSALVGAEGDLLLDLGCPNARTSCVGDDITVS
jgi:hypothetical protein